MEKFDFCSSTSLKRVIEYQHSIWTQGGIKKTFHSPGLFIPMSNSFKVGLKIGSSIKQFRARYTKNKVTKYLFYIPYLFLSTTITIYYRLEK